MMRFFFAFLLVSLTSVAASNDDTKGYLSAMSDFLECHVLGDDELMRVIKACEKGEIVNPILESAANVNPLTLVYREALQSWITPGKLDAAAVCDYAKSRLTDEARQKEEQKGAKKRTAQIYLAKPSILSSTDQYTCAVTDSNNLVCWGHKSSSLRPAVNATGVRSVVTSDAQICTIHIDNHLACWGNPASKIPAHLGPVTSVALGFGHACAVKLDGTLLCWGANDQNQATPPDGVAYKSVVAAGNYTCAIRLDDSLACWGSNSSGQSSPPEDLGPVRAVVAAVRHACAIRWNHQLVCWGFDRGVFYALDNVRSVATGFWNICAIKTDDTVHCYGKSDAASIPPAPDLGAPISIAVGWDHACAIKPDHSVFCWGSPAYLKTTPPEGLKVLANCSSC